MSRLSPLVGLALLSLVFSSSSFARKSTPLVAPTPDPATSGTGNQAPGPGVIGAGVLQLWTFDNANGTPNAQGWTPVDRTAQPPMFHVVNGPAAPGFAGHAVWCGVGTSNCSAMDACAYATLPGYGNNWKQFWATQSIGVDPNYSTTVVFNLSYDMEPSYDFLYLEYTTGGNVWNLMGTWNGTGNVIVSKSIPAGTYTSPIRVRLRFVSDGAYSDEDGQYDSSGPVYIDNLSIINNGVFVDSHDFTAEALNATNTVDGHWIGFGPVAFGNKAALFDGDAVVQQDPGVFNSTNMWGFFNGSAENYACGGFPGQAIVPHGSTAGGVDNYIRNEIQSPVIPLTGVGATEAVMLTFDAYMDLPRDNLIFYEYRVRSRVATVWQAWKKTAFVYDDGVTAAKAWKVRSHDLRPLIPAAATDIQIGLGVVDMCPYWCGIYGSGVCHSHSPLIDNISVTGSNTATGGNVQVTPVDATTGTTPVTITYGNVTQPGLTTLTTGPTGPAVSGSFQIANGNYYNISTSATTTGNITVCINYNQATLTVPESSLRMGHWDTALNPDAWVDITTSLDTVNDRICGTTDHLSPFVIGGGSVTAVGNGPAMPALHQNVPNPFNPTTTIAYDVPSAGARVSIRVYDTAGRLVRTLVDRQEAAGAHDVTWDGRDEFGSAVASGVYFYKMTAGSFVESRRMVLLK